MKKIWVNTIVHNEENFIWFSVMSVVDYVDKVLIWDTGSSDKTIEIIKEIKREKGDKIEFREVGIVNSEEFPKMRQSMLGQSDCDWLIVLDGDEIWWRSSIKTVVKEINTRGNKIDGIVVPMLVSVGDIYHFQEEQAGQYKLLGRKGHLSLRAFNKKIPRLHVGLPYGQETYFDANEKPIQEREKIVFLEAPYLHVTHLKRSSRRQVINKFKFEIGDVPPNDFKYPEVFYSPYPHFIPSPWNRLKGKDLAMARLLTPLRKLKRRSLF